MKTLDDVFEELWALRSEAERLNVRVMDLLRVLERKKLDSLKVPVK